MEILKYTYTEHRNISNEQNHSIGKKYRNNTIQSWM